MCHHAHLLALLVTHHFWGRQAGTHRGPVCCVASCWNWPCSENKSLSSCPTALSNSLASHLFCYTCLILFFTISMPASRGIKATVFCQPLSIITCPLPLLLGQRNWPLCSLPGLHERHSKVMLFGDWSLGVAIWQHIFHIFQASHTAHTLLFIFPPQVLRFLMDFENYPVFQMGSRSSTENQLLFLLFPFFRLWFRQPLLAAVPAMQSTSQSAFCFFTNIYWTLFMCLALNWAWTRSAVQE